MKHIFSYSLILFISLFVLFSCEQPNDPPQEDFSFELSVKDTTGEPITGYNVYVYYDTVVYPTGARPNTRIRYTLEQESAVTLKVYDLQNTLLNTLVDEVENPGSHSHNYNINSTDSGTIIKGNYIFFKYNLIARDVQTREVLFEDTKYMCRDLYNNFGNYNIGETDFRGNFSTDYKPYFPHLYYIPEIQHYNETGTYEGTSEILEDAVIVILNPETNEYQSYPVDVEQGANSFDLVWDNTRSKKVMPGEAKDISEILNAEKQEILRRTPHPVYIEVWDCDRVQIPAGDVYYEAVITERPDEIVEIGTNGWEYGGVIPGYLSGNTGSGFSTWVPGETLEITLTQLSTGYNVTNSWILTSGGYEHFPNPGGIELSLGDDCEIIGPNIDWGNGVTGNVTGGIPSNPGFGYGTGLPNEDLLADPTDVGYYFILTIDENEPVDVTLCIDQIAFGYVPYNLAYWINGEWSYVPEVGSQVLWINPGTNNSCVTFNIDSTLRADVPIVLFGPDDGPYWPPPPPPPDVTNEGEYVLITWTVFNETEMYYYRVYRDGLEVAQVEALNESGYQTYEVMDIPEYEGTYIYTLEAIKFDGTSQLWGPMPVDFYEGVWHLHQNYPNPFN